MNKFSFSARDKGQKNHARDLKMRILRHDRRKTKGVYYRFRKFHSAFPQNLGFKTIETDLSAATDKSKQSEIRRQS